MYNPIRFIKDVIDILRSPSGEAVAAMEIVPENIELIRSTVTETYGPAADNYVTLGDYYLEFESMSTIVPKGDFHRHYAFTKESENNDPTSLRPVRTIKPL